MQNPFELKMISEALRANPYFITLYSYARPSYNN